MFAFMHPYQTIRRLEQENAALRAELAIARSAQSCRTLSLMTPFEAISLLQTKGARMLESLSKGAADHAQQLASERATLNDMFEQLHVAEQTTQTLHQQRQRLAQADAHYAAPFASEAALQSLRKIAVELARSAGHAHALSVNASLEAAHHPASTQPTPVWPVIAQDIQQISEQTQRLAQQLEQWLEQAGHSLKEDARVLAHQREVANALACTADTAERVITQLSDRARHLYKVIHHGTTTACLEAAKLEHAVWKSHIYHQLLSANVDEHPSDHQHCALGCWYFTGEGQRYQRMDAYRALAVPHRRFHESGLEALRLARQGDHTGQLAALALMEEASITLAEQLDRLMEEAVYDTPLPSPTPLTGMP
ncbi:chemotaxis protein [Vreelandella venusta]|nr:chemotaxis protein [Halomonas hydrothermalis]